MLNTQTMDKLQALRLEGMAQALDEQRRQPDISQLEFEERLALLVERQWLWRENRALAARLHYAQLKIPATLEDIDYRHPRGLKRAPNRSIARFRMGPPTSQLFDYGTDRIGENLPGLRTRPPGRSRRPPRRLLLCPETVPGTAQRPG